MELTHRVAKDLSERLDAAIQQAINASLETARRDIADAIDDECQRTWKAALQEGRAQDGHQTRTQTAEGLAQAVRDIRSESTLDGVAARLLEKAGDYAGRCALFIHRNGRVLGFRTVGFSSECPAKDFQELDFPLSEAAAIAHAVDTRLPLTTTGRPNELSGKIVEMFGLSAHERIWFFPIVLGDRVLALVYADGKGAGRGVEKAAIEILTSVAEAWIEALGSRQKPVRPAGEPLPQAAVSAG